MKKIILSLFLISCPISAAQQAPEPKVHVKVVDFNDKPIGVMTHTEARERAAFGRGVCVGALMITVVGVILLPSACNLCQWIRQQVG